MERLGKFRLSKREEEIIEISFDDTKISRERCKKSLVGRIFGQNAINFTGLKQTMSKLWYAEGELKVIELKSKLYQFVFSNEEERMRVLEKCPWSFDN